MLKRLFAAAALAAGIAAAGATLAGPALAQGNYPDKPIKLIVPFPPGGSTDAVARFVATELSAKLGQQVVIDNRAGANGSVGTQAAKEAPADGYTLLLGSSGVLLVNPSLYPDVTYNAANDFSYVGKIAQLTNVVIISNRLAGEGVKTLADFIKYAKANPGKLNFGSGGIGNGGHLAGELLKKTAGIDAVHVPFKGGAEAARALIAGDIDFLINTTPEALPLIKAKQAVPLAVMTHQRLSALPDVPMIKEVGIQGAEMASWMSVMGPKGVPQPVIARLSKDLQDILSTDEAKTFFEGLELTRDPGTPEALHALIVQDGPRFAEFLKASGATLK